MEAEMDDVNGEDVEAHAEEDNEIPEPAGGVVTAVRAAAAAEAG